MHLAMMLHHPWLIVLAWVLHEAYKPCCLLEVDEGLADLKDSLSTYKPTDHTGCPLDSQEDSNCGKKVTEDGTQWHMSHSQGSRRSYPQTGDQRVGQRGNLSFPSNILLLECTPELSIPLQGLGSQ